MNRQAIIKQFGTAEALTIVENEVPEPKSDEVRVKIEAASLTSTDLTIRKGLYPLLKLNPPFVLGYDFVGKIDKVGSEVIDFQKGERVAGICQIGGHSDYINVAPTTLLRVDSSLESEKVACLVQIGVTAYQMYHHFAKVRAGDRFLIHGGSGAVGNLLVQLCRLNEVQAVATASNAKQDFVRNLSGIPIDYQAANYAAQLKKEAGDGFDAALDFTNQKSINRSFRLLKKGGRLILSGLLNTQQQVEKKTFWSFLKFGLEFGGMMLKKARWNQFTSKDVHFFGIVDSRNDHPDRYQNDFTKLLRLVENGQLHLHFATYKLEEARQAQLDLENGKIRGQLILSML